jgi:hypothetical protein
VEIKLGDLASRATRKVVVGNSNGIRRFSLSGFGQKKDDDGNILSSAISAIYKFGGFLVSKLFEWGSSLLSWTFSSLWGLVVNTYQFIYNFNWNQSDEQLDQTAKQAWETLAGSVGGLAGNAVGWLACGILPGAAIFAFNEALGVHILNEVGQEALQEFCANAAPVVQGTFRAIAQTAVGFFYKKARSYWRKQQKSKQETEWAQKIANKELTQEQVDAQRKKRDEEEKEAKPWSFALKVEEKIESIPNEAVKNFAEEFLEEFGDACIEAGYVVAGAIDSYIAKAKIANRTILGNDQTVEITFNRSLDPVPSSGGTAPSTP